MPKVQSSIETMMLFYERQPIFLPRGFRILAEAIEHAAENWYPEIYNEHTEELSSCSYQNENEVRSLKSRDMSAKNNACFHSSKILAKHLFDGSIPSFVLAEGHEIKPVPSAFWNTLAALHIINNREVMIDFVGVDFNPVRGVIIVDEEKFLLTVRQHSNSGKAVEIPSIFGTDNLAEISPYMRLMIRASKHFGLVNGNGADGSRVLKEEIQEWLSNNWSTELGDMTNSLVSSMATLIRHPQAGNGGNTKRIERKFS